MLKEKINIHQRFIDVFTDEELEDIVENAVVVTNNCIVINTKDYFFELNIDYKEEVDIFCYNSVESSENNLSKLEFMKLYNSNNKEDMDIINIDE